MPTEPKIAHLAALRALISRQVPGQMAPPPCPLGLPALDAALEGGLPRGCLQEVIPADEGAAAAGFAAFLLGRLVKEAEGGGRGVLWASLGEGDLYPPALAAYGLAPGEVILLSAPSPAELLWAMEEALRCRPVGVVIGEVRSADRLDLVASRRLSLAAGQRDVCAFLLRTAPGTDASAAATRWTVAAAPSRANTAGPGPPRLSVHLTRNRRGPVGSWLVEWNRAQRRFDLAPSLSEPVADAACDRPHHAAARGA